jgi:hypothetical protein
VTEQQEFKKFYLDKTHFAPKRYESLPAPTNFISSPRGCDPHFIHQAPHSNSRHFSYDMLMFQSI